MSATTEKRCKFTRVNAISTANADFESGLVFHFRNGNSKFYAFYVYNIDTDKAGYGSVRNIGVPVFPGVTSVQLVELTPSPEGAVGRYGDKITYNESGTPNL